MNKPPAERPGASLFQRLVGKTRRPEDVSHLREMTAVSMPVLNTDPPHVGPVHTAVPIHEVAGTTVTATIIEPTASRPHPVLLYLHGGGFVSGSSESHHKLACRFAQRGFLVVNLDYRLAPEHSFPAAFDDCVAALEWCAAHAADFGGRPDCLAVAGDSAGANLVAAAAANRRSAGTGPAVCAAALFYGLFDIGALWTDPLANSQDPLINYDVVQMLIAAYLGCEPNGALLADPRVSPLLAAEAMPPTFLACGWADPLLEQSRAFARRLEVAGIAHELAVYADMPHGFAQVEFFPQAREALAAATAFLLRAVPDIRTPG